MLAAVYPSHKEQFVHSETPRKGLAIKCIMKASVDFRQQVGTTYQKIPIVFIASSQNILLLLWIVCNLFPLTVRFVMFF